MAFGKKLRRIFAGVVIAGAALTAVAPPAHAGPVVVNTAATSAATAAAAAAAARNARLNREAVNEVIVNPTETAIKHADNRGQVDWTTIPYIQEAVREMNIPAGTKADSITEAQRSHFQQSLRDKRLVAQMSSNSRASAEAKGMSEMDGSYFDITKEKLGYSGPVTLSQAREIQEKIDAQVWENHTLPALKMAGMIGGGVVAVGGAAYALTKRRRDGYGY